MKKNEGITLIALVVTIIVLLILAGVAIAMLTGDNSILKRAQSTKAYNIIGAVKDEVSTAYNAAYAEYMRQQYDEGITSKITVTNAFGAELTNSKIVTGGAGAHGATIKYTAPTVKISVDVDGTTYKVAGTLTDRGTSSTFTWGSISETSTSEEEEEESFGLSSDETYFIGQKSTGKVPGKELDNAQTSNPTADGTGYKFETGHFVYAENYRYYDYETDSWVTGNVYLCWDNDDGEITSASQRQSTSGAWDVFSPSGAWLSYDVHEAAE